MEKGDKIRFVKGSYPGRTGWINKTPSEKVAKGMVAVIVLMDKKKDKVKLTVVERSSIRKRFSEPKSKEEAALQQHSKLELAMIEHAERWAEMGTIDTNKVVKLFTNELAAAQKHQRRYKTYKHVEYTPKTPHRRRRSHEC